MEERCDVGKIINRISHQLKRRMNCHEEEDSLTNMQRHVLHYILLQSMSRDIYQKDVEAEFQIRRSTATGILQLLEKNGFILRKAEDRDARLKKIVPTEKEEKRKRSPPCSGPAPARLTSPRPMILGKWLIRTGKNGGLYRNAGTDFRQFVWRWKMLYRKTKDGGSRRSVIKADQRKLCREGNSSGERKQHVNKNQ